MLVALIADTHLRVAGRLPERCKGLIAEADAVIHAGDVMTEAALAEIVALGRPVHAVHGNVDEPALQATLPAELELDIADARVAVVHDAGPSHGRLPRLRARFPLADAVIFGHSHMPEHIREAVFRSSTPGARRSAGAPPGTRWASCARAAPPWSSSSSSFKDR